jgi:hypothetical protein
LEVRTLLSLDAEECAALMAASDEEAFEGLVDSMLQEQTPMVSFGENLHALHGILTGPARDTDSDSVAGFPVGGGTPLWPTFGARVFSATEVRAVAERCTQLTPETIAERSRRESLLDARIAREVYWRHPLEREDQVGHLRRDLERLLAFVAVAGRDQRAILLLDTIPRYGSLRG